MEIRRVIEIKEAEYPFQEEMPNSKITKSIPKKWKKAGIGFLLMELLLSTNTYATTTDFSKLVDVKYDGGLVSETTYFGGLQEMPTRSYEGRWNIINSGMVWIEIFIVPILLITAIYSVIKNKKQNEKIKFTKLTKVLFAISIILAVLIVISPFFKELII